jgi:hypothetical protein
MTLDRGWKNSQRAVSSVTMMLQARRFENVGGVLRMDEDRPESHLKEFFLKMTGQSFSQLGMSDRQIVEYVASLLTEFSRSDRWLLLQNAEGQRLTSTVEMLLSQLGPESRTRVLGERALRKYVGDYTLFMSGLFRGHVERGGYLDYYLEEGKRSYHRVSKLDVALYRPGFLVFEELSNGFEGYSGALDYMRKCFFAAAPGQNPFAGFLKQIEGWVHSRFSDN